MDNGPGMPPDVAAKAIEPLFTIQRIGKGSGLGLSQVWTSGSLFDSLLVVLAY